MKTVIQNNSITFSITPYLTDRGWSILSGSSIEHSKPNSGELEVINIPIAENTVYEYSFNVDSLTGGTVVVSIGGVDIPAVTSSGYVQGQITTVSSDNMKIWSDADTVISGVNIVRQISEDNVLSTLTWGDNRRGWVTFKTMVPDSGFGMYTNMFTLKEGNLWIHTTDAIPNNIYGEQYHSTIKFPVSSIGVKTYHTIAIHGNKVLGTTENGITTQLGNVTDLITYDFTTSEEGVHYANKLRDQLLNEKLKGRYIVVELSDEETKEQKLQLFKVVMKSEVSSPNE